MDGFNHNNQVRIVQKKNDKKIYAIKYIGKIKCLEMKVRCVLCVL